MVDQLYGCREHADKKQRRKGYHILLALEDSCMLQIPHTKGWFLSLLGY